MQTGGKTNQNPQSDLGQSAASAAAALRAVYLSALARWCCRRIPTRALLQPVALETEPRMGVGGLVVLQCCVVGAVISGRTRFYLHAVN